MSNYNDECIQDYTCPNCKEAKLQSDKNARKINEVIEHVNALIDIIGGGELKTNSKTIIQAINELFEFIQSNPPVEP